MEREYKQIGNDEEDIKLKILDCRVTIFDFTIENNK